MSDVVQWRARKVKELDYYQKQLTELNQRIGMLRGEVDLTTRIINMIEHEEAPHG